MFFQFVLLTILKYSLQYGYPCQSGNYDYRNGENCYTELGSSSWTQGENNCKNWQSGLTDNTAHLVSIISSQEDSQMRSQFGKGVKCNPWTLADPVLNSCCNDYMLNDANKESCDSSDPCYYMDGLWKKKSCDDTSYNPVCKLVIPQCGSYYAYETQVCNGRGYCISDGLCSCEVEPNWEGDNCEIPICVPPCEHDGTCIDTNPSDCDCSTVYPPGQWDGDYCDEAQCNPVCENGGTCTSSFDCDCSTSIPDPGWGGDNCTIPLCDTECDEHGDCQTSPGNCVCDLDYEWYGDNCDMELCFGEEGDRAGCDNHGYCSVIDHVSYCTCDQDYYGPQCQEGIPELIVDLDLENLVIEIPYIIDTRLPEFVQHGTLTDCSERFDNWESELGDGVQCDWQLESYFTTSVQIILDVDSGILDEPHWGDLDLILFTDTNKIISIAVSMNVTFTNNNDTNGTDPGVIIQPGDVLSVLIPVLLVAICLCVVLVLCVILSVVYYVLRNKSNERKQYEMLHELNNMKEMYVQDVTDLQKKIVETKKDPMPKEFHCANGEDLKIDKKIGKGTTPGSTMFLAIWMNEIVFLKCFQDKITKDSIIFESFQEEMELYSKFNHENLLKYYAYTQKPYRIMTEYAAFGNLKHYFNYNKKEGKTISMDDKIKMLIQIAEAVSYLHSKNYVHKDLSSYTIYVTKNNKIKIDYSFTKTFMKDYKLSPQYTAPELMGFDVGDDVESDGEDVEPGEGVEFKIDVYSFGIVAFEMITENFNALEYYEVRNFKGVISGVGKGKRPVVPGSVTKWMKSLLEMMWAVDPYSRPAFKAILTILKKSLKN